MENIQDPDQIDQGLKELQDLIAETEEELAASKDRPNKPSRPSVAKISYLVDIAKDILSALHQKTHNAKEARFVASVVKAAIDYWHQEDSRDVHGRK